jgi:hypothetical protein
VTALDFELFEVAAFEDGDLPRSARLAGPFDDSADDGIADVQA